MNIRLMPDAPVFPRRSSPAHGMEKADACTAVISSEARNLLRQCARRSGGISPFDRNDGEAGHGQIVNMYIRKYDNK